MALSTLAIAVLAGTGIVVFFVALYFMARFFQVDLFGWLGSWNKKKGDEIVKTQMLPDDEAYRIVNEKTGFKELVSGYKVVGKDEKTGKDLIRFTYGEDKITEWTVPLDADYFKINVKRVLSGKKPLEYRIVSDTSVIAQLKSENSRLQLYGKGVQSKLDLLSEDEKIRMQKHVEYQKEEKRIAFGNSGYPYQTGGSSFRPYRPWGSAPQGEGGEEMI